MAYCPSLILCNINCSQYIVTYCLLLCLDLSPLAVFTKHTPEMLGVVSNADSLIADLISAGVIPEDDVTSSTSNGDSRFQRVEMLLNTVQRCLVKSNKPEEVLLKFSIVLKNQKDDNLKKLSNEMRS